MSASREKRERKLSKEPAPVKKTHKLRNWLIVCVVAVALLYMAASSLGMFHRALAAVSVGDVSFSAAEVNMSFNVMVQQYGLSKEEAETYKAYLLPDVRNNLQNEGMLSREAEKNGMALSEENKQMIEATVSYMKEQAKLANMSFPSFMALNYGEGVTESVFRKATARSLLAYQWQQKKQEEFSAPTEECETYYTGHTEAIDKAVYYSYSVTWTTEEEATEEEIAAAKAAAKAKAGTLNSGATSLDSLYEGLQALEIDTTKDALVRTAYLSNVSPTELQDFLKDSARKRGDHTLIETDSAYNVVIFESLAREEYLAPSYDSITVTPSDAEDAASLQEARDKADAILQEWQAGEKTEASFTALAAQKAESGVVTDNGLTENAVKTFMNSEEQAWLFNTARKTGDAVVVDTGSSYKIIYFVKWSDKPYWEIMTNNMIINEKAGEYTAQLAEQYPYKTHVLGQLLVTNKEEPEEPSPSEDVLE